MLKENIDAINETVKKDSEYILEITDTVISTYIGDLNRIMNQINDEIVCKENVPTSVIEKYFLELSNYIYFVVDNVERVGIFDGVSKANAQQAYNSHYMVNQTSGIVGQNKKPTVAESTIYAQDNSLEESMVNEIYSRAYRTIKSKIDAAQTMISTLSKVLSRRMAENQFSIVNNNTRQILNEEVPTSKAPTVDFNAPGTFSYEPF